MDPNEKKPIDFYTGKMSHSNGEYNFVTINLDSIFSIKDLPSCLYRAAFNVKNSGHITPESFFKDLSFMESMQLYNLSMVVASDLTGRYTEDNPQKKHAKLVARATTLKLIEVLCFGQGDTSVEVATLVDKITALTYMSVAHFMGLTGHKEALYSNFNINAKQGTPFFKDKSDDEETST